MSPSVDSIEVVQCIAAVGQSLAIDAQMLEDLLCTLNPFLDSVLGSHLLAENLCTAQGTAWFDFGVVVSLAVGIVQQAAPWLESIHSPVRLSFDTIPWASVFCAKPC